MGACSQCELGRITVDLLGSQSQQITLDTETGMAGQLLIPEGMSSEGSFIEIDYIRDRPREEEGLGSTIVSVILKDAQGRTISQLDEPLMVCLEADSLSLPSMQNSRDVCLSYLDEESGEWRCQDRNLVSTVHGMLCGMTPHLTNFALLLGPEGQGSTPQWDTTLGWISLGLAAGAILLVLLAAFFVEVWYRYRRGYRRRRIQELSLMTQADDALL